MDLTYLILAKKPVSFLGKRYFISSSYSDGTVDLFNDDEFLNVPKSALEVLDIA